MGRATRPRIAVTTSARSGWRIFPLVALNLWLTGGRGERWGTGRPADLDDVDGLIIGGGDDISPALYGGELVAEARLDPARDRLERGLAEAALARGIPVLGICRGAQMLNVAAGGTLMGDAFARHPESRHYSTILPRRKVRLRPGTWLAALAGKECLKVNALHSQAVDRLGEGMRVSARDGGGMVQAIERVTDPMAIGVQWHPEHLFYRRAQRRIFAALVAAARARTEGRRSGEDQARAVASALASPG
ncbi:gamma-glutamyl-gamma-aminobutyrate hydrolase family protein [Tropicimonas sediminicola]|uniref:Putative glutamine amidotransferase n=1 Tax=Tropicimonas sediminicola TaxID=1031541 RepID=A0A239KXD3_9RHOB|nr:gamma-glutamyl-gamma-aminobutyrate hydrolase family protein [Tropicimonas sediminicola]SNT23037.1 putative glutamine amidotransferase [Tropicimonas sediminicola]